ncbi:hypothetical protein NP493_5g11005 [Ridgeia piscesae]|uniref:Uncharacterized protein n=1 Tax=Ridgeia piscesae TaxID=27915 RepID=A0AAD9PFM0_RIDPI|nr:hypothetical protein NP493_5g11005 [Ridgeia piscesae]
MLNSLVKNIPWFPITLGCEPALVINIAAISYSDIMSQAALLPTGSIWLQVINRHFDLLIRVTVMTVCKNLYHPCQDYRVTVCDNIQCLHAHVMWFSGHVT